MGVRQPPKKRSEQRQVNDLVRQVQRSSNLSSYSSKKKSSVPWWGWAIFIFLGLKACGMAQSYTTDAPPAPTMPVTTTIQGGP